MTSYCSQFTILQPWHHAIFSCVKKDLRNEHLKFDKAFFHTHFGTKVLVKLTVDDLLKVYPGVIAAGHEKLAEFIVNRWLLKHLPIYNFFELHLKLLNPKIEEIEQIQPELSQKLIDEAVEKFGAINTYIFSIFNSVSFSLETFEQLRNRAHEAVFAPT